MPRPILHSGFITVSHEKLHSGFRSQICRLQDRASLNSGQKHSYTEYTASSLARTQWKSNPILRNSGPNTYLYDYAPPDLVKALKRPGTLTNDILVRFSAFFGELL